MPYLIKKIKNKNLYKVINKETGDIKSKHTTLENAKKQIKLLNGIKHGFKPKNNLKFFLY